MTPTTWPRRRSATSTADTIVETNAGELAGLVDTEVTLTVRRTTNVEAPVVLAIGDLDYVVEEPASD